MAEVNGHRQGEFALLDGETRDWSAADAAHWVQVYRELIRFCRRIDAEAPPGDGKAIRLRLTHLERRLAFWEAGPLQKVDEAAAPPA